MTCWRSFAWTFVIAGFFLPAIGVASFERGNARKSHSNALRDHRLDKRGRPKENSSPSVWTFSPAPGGVALDQTVASGGDIDGDGHADVIVGEPTEKEGTGRLLFFFGTSEGLGAAADLVLYGGGDQNSFGAAVRMVGDVNGDGLDDFFVMGRDTKNSRDFGSFFFGGPGRSFPSAVWPNGLSGPIGDVNGDGFDDVAEYVWREDLVHIYHGSPSGPLPLPARTLRAEQAGSHFGHDVAAAGDVNGDGFDDLVVGAMKFNGRYRAGGKVYVFLGSKDGIALESAWVAEYPLEAKIGVDDQHEQFFGWGLAGVGDTNGDGFDDVVVGASFAERGDRNEGIAFLFLGSTNGLSKKPGWIIEGNHPHALLGQSLAPAFDVNGDGFDDVLIGLPQASDGQQNEGAVAIFHGSKRGLGEASGVIESDHSHENLGIVVRSAGDINGDGFADVLLVGPGFEKMPDAVRFGRVLVAFGSRAGLPFSHNFSLKKPLLVAAQHRIERYHAMFGAVVYWLPPGLLVLVVTCGALIMKLRDQARIRSLLAENRALVSSEERSRIAREFHDHVGTDLTEIALTAKSAAQSGEHATTQEKLSEISATVDRALQNMDQLLWITNPADDTLESLLLHIGDFVVKFGRKGGLSTRLQLPEDLPQRRVSAEWRHAVFSSVKELTNNVVRHAKARTIILRASVTDETLDLTVSDDGIGFDLSSQAKADSGRKGGGIQNVKTRLAEVGGELMFRRGPTGGTQAVMHIPLKRTDSNV